METRNQPRKRRFLNIGKSTSSPPVVPTSEEQSQPIPGRIASDARQSGHGFKVKLVAMKSRLALFHRGQSGSSATPIATGSGQGYPQPPEVVQNDGTPIGQVEPDPVQDMAGGDIDAARQAFEPIKPFPRAGEIAINVVARADTAVIDLQDSIDTYLKPLKLFNSVVTTIAKVHPYAQVALAVLTAASQLIIAQANLDYAVSQLLEKVGSVYAFLSEDETIKKIDSMKGSLAKIAQVMSACAQFIKDYSEAMNFWKRLGKNVMRETQTTVSNYTKTLDELMQQYRDCQTRDIQINIYRVLEDLNMEGMAYAGGAGLNTMKKCLESTRREILEDIISWANDASPDTPCILWLHGQAGRGKSAIAHTIASWFKDMGGLGSCFCFARDRQGERREEKMLTTIARDLAGHYPAFQRALAQILAEDHTLKTTPDLSQQWQKLILEPLSKAMDAIVGNVVVVIDALDESGQDLSRGYILSLLASTEVANLSHFRILLTSRALPDIKGALSGATHIKAMCLDDVPAELAQRDIGLFVSKELVGLKDIGPMEIQQIVHKSDGLFEWARLACQFISPNAFGQTVEERFKSLIAIPSGEGRALLDGMYSAILESLVPKSGEPFRRFCSVMRQLLVTLEPLPMMELNYMRSLFPHKDEHYDVAIILRFMAPVLRGVGDRISLVQPLHASFYDFLTDRSRNEVYFIDTSNHGDLTYASLQVLGRELRFNICGLESSYLSNSQVPDLPERIKKNISPHLSYSCKFWAKHLEVSKFDLSIAASVQVMMESERVLFWLEVLSLIGALGGAEGSLRTLARWLEGHAGYDAIAVIAVDGLKFAQNFFTAITCSTPHLYVSALPLSPCSSFLGRILVPKFSHLVEVAQGGLKDWPAAQLVIQGHTFPVTSVAFSPDGNRIISGSFDETVRVWDAKSGDQIGSPLMGHTKCAFSVAFSHDGNRIVSGSWDHTVRVWDVKSGDQIGSPLRGHTLPVTSVAFSPDGNRIVSCSWDETVKVWDAKSGVQIGSPMKGNTSRLTSVAFSPDGNRIVSASEDKAVRVWDANTGDQIGSPLKGHTNWVNSVAFSPDGNRIVSGSRDQTVRVWDANSGDQIGSPLKGHTNWVESVAFSPDGNRIVSGSEDQTVRVWDAKSGVQIDSPLKGHAHGVNSVAFSPDGDRIVSGSGDKTVRVWDAKSGDQIDSPLKGHANGVNSVAFSPDGNRIVSGSEDKTLMIWDTNNGDQIGSPLKGHTSQVTSVGFSPDGNRIVSGSWDNTVRVWDVKNGDQIGNPLMGHTSVVTSVGFSPDGNRIVSGSWDGTVRVWDAKSGDQIGSPMEGHTSRVAFSPGGNRIVSGSWDQIVSVWDEDSVDHIGSHPRGYASRLTSVAFSPVGNRIVSGSRNRIGRVWHADSGVKIGSTLSGDTRWVTSVAFSPDGSRIVSGSRDEIVRVWDANSGCQIGRPLKGHTRWITSVGFSSVGNRIVSGSGDCTVRVWDANSGHQIGSPLKGHTLEVTSVGFSPDGHRIVSGSGDCTVRVWDAKSGVQIGSPLKGHTSEVTSVSFSPDGNRIVSGSRDKIVRVWDAKSGDQIGSPLKGHTSEVTSVASSPNGDSIICTSGIYVPTLTLHPTSNAPAQIHVLKHICFSSVPSHALTDSEQLLGGLISQVNTEPVQLHPDGWLRGPQGKLLLWIPSSLWNPFYSMSTTLIIPRGCMELNLSNMVHGSKWQECFKQVV